MLDELKQGDVYMNMKWNTMYHTIVGVISVISIPTNMLSKHIKIDFDQSDMFATKYGAISLSTVKFI